MGGFLFVLRKEKLALCALWAVFFLLLVRIVNVAKAIILMILNSDSLSKRQIAKTEHRKVEANNWIPVAFKQRMSNSKMKNRALAPFFNQSCFSGIVTS